MISMSLKDNDQLQAKLRELKASSPKSIRKAIGATGRIIKTRMLKIIKAQGGIYGVPQFSPWDILTWRLRQDAAKRSAGQMGGKLAEKYAIQMYKRGGVIQVGWLSALSKYTDAFQTAEAGEFSKGLRYQFHRAGIKEVGSYNRPAREVVEPMAHYLASKVQQWFISVLDKELKRVGIKRVVYMAGEPLPLSEDVA